MHGFTVATLYLIVGGLVFLLGVVILREAPREKANRATFLMLFFGGLGCRHLLGLARHVEADEIPGIAVVEGNVRRVHEVVPSPLSRVATVHGCRR